MLLIQGTPTKRSVIKYFVSLDDPLGLLNPYTVKLKILFQKVCKVGISWDQTIPHELVCEWEHIFEDTMNCSVVVVKRWNANLDGTVTASLVTPKSRVSPMRNQTIPKLELTAALLLSRLMIRIKFEFSVCFNVDQGF